MCVQVCALPGAPLFIHVDDVLHQQVPLQSVNSVSVQDHLMSTGRAAETAAGRECGAASRRQVGIGRLQGGGAKHRERGLMPTGLFPTTERPQRRVLVCFCGAPKEHKKAFRRQIGMNVKTTVTVDSSVQ